MPVIGHAFVGWATAELTRPADRPGQPVADRTWRVAGVIALAYAPDIVAQLTAAVGRRYAGFLSHSLGFALLVSIAVAVVVRWYSGSARHAFALSVCSMLLHDLMDMTQSGDRWYGWPLYRGELGPDRPLVPRGLVPDLAFFGIPAVLVVVALRGWRPLVPGWDRRGWRRLQGPAIALLAVGVAAVVDYARDLRRDQLNDASTLIAAHRYDEALSTLDQASKWPFPARPSRIDYLRAEAHAGRGDRQQAEQLYLSAYAQDPRYFWVVADLAVFYASGDLPRSERVRRAQPYVDRLRRDFAKESAVPQILGRIARLLDTPAPTDTPP